nr:5-hydroxytryptamine receptor 3A-like [Misgurnus anguillicaudatus]
MYLRWLMFFLAFGWVTATDNCSYKGLIEHLGLDSDNFQMKSLRPVYNFSNPTGVLVDLFVTSITDVNEKAQSFATQITLVLGWINEFTRWNDSNFCGLQTCTIDKDKMWIPDITIAESIKAEFAAVENPYVKMFNFGGVLLSETLILTTACKMDLYKFPFDVQTCELTVQSSLNSIDELTVNPFSDASFMTASSKKAFQTQGEWELLSITVSKSNMSTLGYVLDQLKFQNTGVSGSLQCGKVVRSIPLVVLPLVHNLQSRTNPPAMGSVHPGGTLCDLHGGVGCQQKPEMAPPTVSPSRISSSGFSPTRNLLV